MRGKWEEYHQGQKLQFQDQQSISSKARFHVRRKVNFDRARDWRKSFLQWRHGWSLPLYATLPNTDLKRYAVENSTRLRSDVFDVRSNAFPCASLLKVRSGYIISYFYIYEDTPLSRNTQTPLTDVFNYFLTGENKKTSNAVNIFLFITALRERERKKEEEATRGQSREKIISTRRTR